MKNLFLKTIFVFFLVYETGGSVSFAAKNSQALDFGGSFYSGNASSYLVSSLSFFASFESRSHLSKVFFLVNRFRLETLITGKYFASSYGSFLGILGEYGFQFRVNFSKKNILPFVSFGPLIGMYMIRLSSEPSSSSQNQVSLKYGYTVEMGFEKINEGEDSKSGWGLSVGFFQYLPTISLFKFPLGTVQAQGLRFSFRWVLG